jgi:hypothetical protein
VQVLDGHRAYGGTDAILGIASRGWLTDGEGRATIKLRTSTPDLAAKAADIKSGLIRAVSFGYSVQRYEITPAHMRTDGGNVPLYRAVRWTPQEISFVAVPADPNAGTRSQSTAQAHPCEFVRAQEQPTAQHQTRAIPQEPSAMSQTIPNTSAAADDAATRAAADAAAQAAAQASAQAAVQAAATRAADITELCARHGVADLAAPMIRDGKSVDQARAAILESLAQRDAARGGHVNTGSIRTSQDEGETRIRGMEEALAARVDPKAKLTDNGRQFRHMSLLDIGRELLHAVGKNTRGMAPLQVAGEMLQVRSVPGMHTTSDFAHLMSSLANKRLRSAYEENPGTYQMWARRAPNAADFKNINVVQLSAAPDLVRTNEHGEFTYGTMVDAGMSYNVVTSGRILAMTRPSIVNDDLRAFDRLTTAFGASARRLENRVVYALLTANANLADGQPLFSAATGNRKQSNVQTGAGSALQLTSMQAARAAMRLMKGLQGEELNVEPRYLIVPVALEQTAYQLTSANYVPATQSAINEFRSGGRTAVEPIVEPLLDADSAIKWYMAAGSSLIDTIEYCYLDGAEGPVIETKDGFEVDGVSVKCRHDFGAAPVDHRGFHRSAGA